MHPGCENRVSFPTLNSCFVLSLFAGLRALQFRTTAMPTNPMRGTEAAVETSERSAGGDGGVGGRARAEVGAAFLASCPEPLFVIDGGGVIRYANTAAEWLLGRAAGSGGGGGLWALLSEADRAQVRAQLEEAGRAENPSSVALSREVDVLCAEGGSFPARLLLWRLDGTAPGGARFGVIVRDMSAEKRREREHDLLRVLAADVIEAPDFRGAMRMAVRRICLAADWDYGEVWLPDGRGGDLRCADFWMRPGSGMESLSELAMTMRFGPGEGLPGRAWASATVVWLPDIGEASGEAFLRRDAAARAGVVAAAAFPLVSAGVVRAVFVFFLRRRREESRRLVGLVTAAVAPLAAIIESKRANDALQERERWFREMLDGVDALALMLDTEGRVTFCNRSLLRLTGYEPGQVIGKSCIDVFSSPANRENDRAFLSEGIESGRMPSVYCSTLVSRRGEERTVSWSAALVRGPGGGVMGTAAIGVDVTERRLTESRLRAYREHLERLVEQRTAALRSTHEQLRMADRLATSGALAAGLGHDIRNLLLPMRCHLDALEAGGLAGSGREHVDAVRRSLEYLRELSDGLHMLSMDPDEEGIGEGAVLLHEWWERVEGLVRRALHPGTSLRVVIKRDVPGVRIPPHRLTQAVFNLAVNAAEAIGQDEGLVEVGAERGGEGGWVVLRVRDDGCGMTEEVRRRSAEAFFTTKKSGTGLGLALVGSTVARAGGRVEIESSPGAGTTVSLWLPAAGGGGARVVTSRRGEGARA